MMETQSQETGVAIQVADLATVGPAGFLAFTTFLPTTFTVEEAFLVAAVAFFRPTRFAFDAFLPAFGFHPVRSLESSF